MTKLRARLCQTPQADGYPAVVHSEANRHRLELVANRLRVIPALMHERRERRVARAKAGLVAEPLVDLERADVELLGGVEVASQVGNHAEVVMGAGEAHLVAD